MARSLRRTGTEHPEITAYAKALRLCKLLVRNQGMNKSVISSPSHYTKGRKGMQGEGRGEEGA